MVAPRDVSDWRVGRGWTPEELQERLRVLPQLPRNFDEDPATLHQGGPWRTCHTEGEVAVEPPGPPQPCGPFERLIPLVVQYDFSDPDIVRGHFDRSAPLLGRHMLLEIKALRLLRYLCPIRVGAVREEHEELRTTFGFRYDTLIGHIESGTEWFLLTKSHSTGSIAFHIHGYYQAGDLPNWWSKVGFRGVASYYQMRWHALARERLRAWAHNT